MKKLITIFLTLCFCLSPLSVWANEKVIKVGYYPIDGYHNKENNKVTGYEVDYLEEVAIINGWKLEYVEANSLTQLHQLLDQHKVDLISPCLITSERLNQYYLSSDSILSGSGAMVTLEETRIDFNDYTKFSSMTFGIEKGDILEESLKNHASTHDYQLNIKYYNNHDSLMKALNNKDIDGAIMHLYYYDSSYRLISQFSSQSYYFMSYDASIINQLDQAVYQLLKTNPDIKKTLLDKYFPDYSKVPFTKEELQLAESIESLNIGCSPYTDPLCYQEDGKLKGIVIDVLEKISDYIHIDFNYVTLPKGQISYEDLAKMNIDFVADVEFNSINALEKRIEMSMPYLKTEKVFASKGDTPFYNDMDAIVAITSGSASIEELIEESYPHLTPVYYSSLDEAFEALEKDEVQFVLQNRYTLEKELQKPNRQSYSIVSQASIGDLKCMAGLLLQGEDLKVNEKTNNALLLNILNKGIMSLSENEKDQIITNQTISRHYQYTLGDFIYTNRALMIVLVLALVIVLGLLGYIMKMRGKSIRILTRKTKELSDENEHLEFLSQKDALTGLLNKATFQEIVKMYLKQHPHREVNLIFLDIDDFKQVNDTLGHVLGDIALQAVADSLKDHFVHDSFISRFGGDEFCLMCYSTESIEDRLIQLLNDIQMIILEGKQITASAGCYCFEIQDQTFEELVEKADQALYDAKNLGKNRYMIEKE